MAAQPGGTGPALGRSPLAGRTRVGTCRAPHRGRCGDARCPGPFRAATRHRGARGARVALIGFANKGGVGRVMMVGGMPTRRVGAWGKDHAEWWPKSTASMITLVILAV